MNCNTTHYRANSSSVPGDPTRKPFGRADRKDRKEGGWNPDAGFERSSEPHTEGAFDARPRREYNDRPQRNDGFKKPFAKRQDNFASNTDSYKRTNSGERKEGGFKKPYNRDGAEFDRPRRNASDRPQRSEGYQGNREGGFKKPFRKEGEAFKKPYNRDGAGTDRPRSGEARPFRKDGQSEGRGNAGFKKPYVSKDGGAKRKEGQRFRKDSAPRPEGHEARSRNRNF